MVLSAWRLSPGVHELGDPASDHEIETAERELGRPLPGSLRSLYEFSNGMDPLGGNLVVEPLSSDEGGGLVRLADRLRGWGWPIPDEVLVFGGNGAEDQFGLWYPVGADPHSPTPVVMVGAVFEPSCLALVGTTLPRFLRAWSGYYLVLLEAPAPALDALGLPDALRRIDDEAGLAPYFAWADPDLPDHDPNPYERGMTAEGLASLVG